MTPGWGVIPQPSRDFPIHEIKPLIARAKKSKKYAWLREYDSMALQETVRNLNKAYRAFFERRAGFPHYKSRRGPQSSYHCTGVSVGLNYVRVPKMEPIKARIHREVVGKVKSIIRCHTNFRHPFNLSWSGKTCDIRRSSKTTS